MNYLRSRAVPIGAAALVGTGIYWQTAGGRNQPTGHAARGNIALSETLEGKAGSGGQRARKQGDLDSDPKDTRIISHSPDAHSKRNPIKARSLPGDE